VAHWALHKYEFSMIDRPHALLLPWPQDNAMVSGAVQRIDNRKVTLIAAARGGGAALLSSYKLFVYGGAFRNDSMLISLCRYGSDMYDCPSQVGRRLRASQGPS
jgi:hypothetical protein